MKKTPLILKLESRHGKPIQQVIVDTYNAKGSIKATADALGVKPDTLYYWMQRFGVHVKNIAFVA